MLKYRITYRISKAGVSKKVPGSRVVRSFRLSDLIYNERCEQFGKDEDQGLAMIVFNPPPISLSTHPLGVSLLGKL